MQPIQPKKRFIAGAVCPTCSLLDKIVVYRNESGDWVQSCVSCGYLARMPSELDEQNPGTIASDRK